MSKKSLFKLSATALAVLYGINTFIDSSSVKKNKKPNGKYYHWKHGDIYYKKTGNGAPLLLVHDLSVFSSNFEWSETVKMLSENHTVYALDLIGCGKSDKPEITYTNFFYVQMISDFVKDIIGSKTKVAATGLSASFVLMANSINPELFNKIIMINPKTISALKKSPDERSKILSRLFNLPVIGKTAYYIAVSRPNTEYLLTEKMFYNPFKLKESVVKAYYTAAHTSNGKGKSLLSSLDGQYINIDIINALKSAGDTKLCIITGDHYEKAAEINNVYRKLNSEIRTISIAESKYLPQLEKPEELVSAFYI